MNIYKSALIVISCFLFSTFTLAQKNELSFSVGAIHSSDQTETPLGDIPCVIGNICSPVSASTGTGVAFEANYARQLVKLGPASLDVEVPLVGAPGRDVKLSIIAIDVPVSISTWTLFLTPSARVKFHAGPIQPFVSVGGGWEHHGTTVSMPFGILPASVAGGFSFNTTSDNGVLQFGGGADFKTPLPHLAIRVEVRDFFGTGIAQGGGFLQVSPQRQHNIFGAGGVVLRF
jgi:hypothetical protein